MGKLTTTPSSLAAAFGEGSAGAGAFQHYLDRLKTQMMEAWDIDLGVPVPNAEEADVRSVSSFAQYSTALNVDELKRESKTLMEASDEPALRGIADRAIDVVGNGVTMALTNLTGEPRLSKESALIQMKSEHKAWVVAIYCNVVQPEVGRWKVNERFVVATYIFVVWEPDPSTPAGKKILAHFGQG